MKLNKIMAIFLVVLFVSCIALTAFASEQPLFLPEPEGILPGAADDCRCDADRRPA